MASWPWQKRWMYYDSLSALEEARQSQMPDFDENGEMPDTSQLPNSGSVPNVSGMNPGGMGSSKDVPQSVAQHETVIKSQSH